MKYGIIQSDCEQFLSEEIPGEFDLTFLDPPFNQNKDYSYYNDSVPEPEYWAWMKKLCTLIFKHTSEGGSIYFMQREKNAKFVLDILESSGWTYQNLIIWKKKTSAVPSDFRFSKQYQIIVFATKGRKPRVFNKLRIDLPILPEYKYERENGVYIPDIWDDIRELTSGYFAGEEAIRDNQGKRFHNQQSPIALLLRVVLSSTLPGDTVLDPFAGTGTTLVVANQLKRNFIGIEIDPENIKITQNRLEDLRASDNILKYCDYYRYTSDLEKIWPGYIWRQRRLL